MSKENYERAAVLLAAARELLERQSQSGYVLDLLSETVHYDEADCDGHCLMEDIGYLLEDMQKPVVSFPSPDYQRGQEDALAALGHVPVANGRCTARYKQPENPATGPKGIPVWCDLPAGHDGPHRHVHGHRSSIMDRQSLIEFVPLPDLCKKCGTKWPCKEVETVLRALPAQQESVCEWKPSAPGSAKYQTGCGKSVISTGQEAGDECCCCDRPIRLGGGEQPSTNDRKWPWSESEALAKR